MSTTCGEMIDEVLGLLESWSLDEEQATTLEASIGSTDTSFTVTSSRGIATGISPGMVEIEQELLYCDTVNGNACTVVPWGRGYKSTTAASHAAGVRVVSQPTFPRSKVLSAMNRTLERVFPDLYSISQVELTTTVPILTYTLPDDAEWVLAAKWQLPDGRKYWQSVNRWRMSPGLGTQFGDSGKTVDVADVMMPGRPIQFIYAYKPTWMTTEADVFATVTGLPESVADVIYLGAAAHLVTSQELSRLQLASVEQQNRAQEVAPAAALTSSRYLEQRYQTRLAEERTALQRLYPPKLTRTWR